MPGVSVTSYLKYLHEVSRRIIQRGGFHAIPAKFGLPCLVDGHLLEKYLPSARELLKKGEIGLFVGFDILCGKTGSGRGGRAAQTRVSAPLLFAAAEIIEDEEGRGRSGKLSFEPLWESLTLNIDLLTLLLTGSAEYVPEEEDEGLPGEGIPQITLDRLAELEVQIEQDSFDAKIQRNLMAAGDYTLKVLQRVITLLPQTSKISISSDSFRPADLEHLCDAAGLTMQRGTFLFLAAVPSQLSTTVALHRLVRECESDSFQSGLLEDLLIASLQQGPFDINCVEPDEAEISAAVESIPMPLSASQRIAIHNAWTHRVSYVQGPPGTGKSHTITALMLSALALGKRVLMVSHKPAAVAIVRDKVNELLGCKDGKTVVVEASPASENRLRVRQFIRDIVSESRPTETARLLRTLSNTVAGARELVQNLQAEFARTTDAVRRELEYEKEFLDMTEALLEARRSFCQAFSIDENTLRDTPRPPNPSLWQRSLMKAESLIGDGATGIRRLDLLYLKRFFKASVRALRAETSRLRAGPAAIIYLRQLDKIIRSAADLDRKQRSMNAQQLRSLRGQLDGLCAQLLTARSNLLQLSYRLQLATALKEPSTRESLDSYASAMRFVNPRLLAERINSINVKEVTNSLPLWVAEMRNLGNFLPFHPDLFDLVIVDEASQVNIAEIIPAISRGQRLCVVGDTKQLGLESVGLFFLNQRFELLCWVRAFGNEGVTLKDADASALRVSKHSILDFITSEARRFRIPKVTLNEHFRSVPGLAAFTSSFYQKEDGDLLLMRETASNVQRQCFKFIQVHDGKREGKVVPQEAEEVCRLLKGMINGVYPVNKEGQPAMQGEQTAPPSIGVLCFLTEQRNYLRHRISEEFDEGDLSRHDVLVGTTEEFQGNERTIMILTFGIDAGTRYAKGFYENLKRFNVATSRATDFTYAITSAVPRQATLLRSYFRRFGAQWTEAAAAPLAEIPESPDFQRAYWTYDPKSRESEFERRVDEVLQEFIRSVAPLTGVALYNQVSACGQKRLDFVLHNLANDKCCAVEVDGRCHFVAGGRTYSEEHLERVDILRRAGWALLHVAYYDWYSGGWLCDGDDARFRKHVMTMFSELRRLLQISN